MTIIKNEYPAQLLNYLANGAGNSMVGGMILGDEYVFATFFSAMMQGLTTGVHDPYAELTKIVTTHCPSFTVEETTIEIDLTKQERMMKIVEGLRAQFNEQVTTTYVRDFFFSISVFNAINSEKNYNKSVIAF